MHKIIFILLLLTSCQANASEFYELFESGSGDYTRLANQVTKQFTEGDQRDVIVWQQQLEYISAGLNDIQSLHETDPVYWFVRGIHAHNMASFYHATQNISQSKYYVDERNNTYQKAMTLDKNHEPHLSAAMYATMKPGLPEALKQQAIESELNLGGSGENESYYWYLHWSNINSLQKQQRFDEADQALARMKKELAASGQRAAVFNQLAEKAEKELNQKKNQQPLQQPAISKNETAPVRDHKAFTEEKVDDEYYQYLFIVGLIMLGLAVIALVFELNRRKKLK